MILTNLLSNVENLPKIGPARVLVPYTEGRSECPRRAGRGGVSRALPGTRFLSLSSVFRVGPGHPGDGPPRPHPQVAHHVQPRFLCRKHQ